MSMDMLQQPLVSVIIPFYNEEKFLSEAIESVRAQDYKNWELLVVDDGSSDMSAAIAKKYADTNPGKIVYRHHAGHANKGLSATRNEGIRQSKGDLLAFLDADDTWLPEKLTNQVAIFQEYMGIAMVAEASDYWFSWSDPEKQDIRIPVGVPQDRVFEPAELLQYLYPLSNGAAPCPSGLMVTKEAVAKVGGFEESFTKQYQLYEDQAFLHKIYLKERVFISSSCHNRYRQRVGSIVQQVHSANQYHEVRKHFLEWLEEYLQREQLQDRSTQLLLRKALAPYHYPKLYFLTQTLPGKIERIFRNGIKNLSNK